MTLLESLVSLAVVAGVASATFDFATEVESKAVEYQQAQIDLVKKYKSKIQNRSIGQ